MQTFPAQLAELEAKLRHSRIPVRRLCAAAEIAPSTWTRWKAGDTSPTFSTWEKLQKAASRLILESEAA